MPAPMTREEREAFLAGAHVGVLRIDEPGRGLLSVPVWYLRIRPDRWYSRDFARAG
jgi:hypothetical protein